MNNKVFLFPLMLGVTWFVEAKLLNSNEIDAQKFALKTSEKIFKFYDHLKDQQYNEDKHFYIDRSKSILNESTLLLDIIDQAKKFDFKNFKNKELKYAFEEIVKIADELIIGGDRYNKILDSLDKLRELATNEKYFYSEECDDNSSGSDVWAWLIPQEIIAKSNNSKEIEYYWKAVRKTSGKWANENLNLMLKGLRDAANLSDQSPLDFWLREYNLTELGNLMSEIQPLYNELHTFIRNGLQQKYGNSIIKSDGLIPHHLFEQVLTQVWTNESIIEDLFPYDNLPPIASILATRFRTIELYEIADRFYEKLGFTKIPYQVWKDHIKMKREPDTYDCKADVFYTTPNIHLEFCENILDLAEFLEIYSDMGKLYYAKEMTDLPAYYFNTHDLEYAIGKAAILSASTHHNLKAVGLIVEFNFTDEVEMNRLLRKGIGSLLNIAVEFVHVKLMADLLSGNIELEDLNNKYWKLMDEYVGVGPPMNHKTDPDAIDIPASFYYDMNANIQSRKFESEIMSYQIYQKFCKLSGKYPKEPLHLCDMHGTKAAGDVLKNMMRLGTSKPFNEVFATMFPAEPRVSAEGILEYYSPVKNFLVEKNLEAKVKPGWRHAGGSDEKDFKENASVDSPYNCEL